MLFTIHSIANFAQASISWSYGHFVLYIISLEDFDATTRVGPSLILMQACFNQAQQTCHKHKKIFVWGHTSLGYMQWWSELILFIFPQTSNNNCVYFHIAINSFFKTQTIYLYPCIIHNEGIWMPIVLEHQVLVFCIHPRVKSRCL